MRKLSLKNLKLGADELLQREQLKSVLGGFNGGYGSDCNSSEKCPTGCSETKYANGQIGIVCNYCCIA